MKTYEPLQAHKIVAAAIREGALDRKPCEICGVFPAEAHHANYKRPLSVRWLCRLHHIRWHRANDPPRKPRLIKADKLIVGVTVLKTTRARLSAAMAKTGLTASSYIGRLQHAVHDDVVVSNLGSDTIVTPTHESQVRPLAKLELLEKFTRDGVE
jgi:hypothetical protein